MVIKSTTCIAPEILTYYDAILLSRPIPKFRDDSKTLWDIYLYLKKHLFKKARNDSKRHEKLLKLEAEFLEVYGIAKTKEKDIEAKTGESAKKPFYYIGSTDRKNDQIFARLKYKR